MQVIHIEAIDGQVTPRADGSGQVTGATDVRIYLGGYTDYLQVYTTFNDRI